MQQGNTAVIILKELKAKPEYKGVVMLEISISYPEVIIAGNEAVSIRISTFYNHMARRAFNHAMHNMYESAVQEYKDSIKNNFPFRSYDVVSIYNVTYNKNGFLSIYSDNYEYTGGAHGNTIRQADSFNTSSGAHMALNDFFKHPYYRQVILSSIFRQINAQISKGQDIYFDDYQKNVFEYFSEKNYYITNDGFAIYFPLYSIAPYVAGIIVFVTPFADFGVNLKYKL